MHTFVNRREEAFFLFLLLLFLLISIPKVFAVNASPANAHNRCNIVAKWGLIIVNVRLPYKISSMVVLTPRKTIEITGINYLVVYRHTVGTLKLLRME